MANKFLASEKLSGLNALLTADLRSLAAMRIMLGLILISDLLLRIPDIGLYYTGEGIFSVGSMKTSFWMKWFLSLHAMNESYWFQFALLILSLICAVIFTVGFRTRVFAILSWILLVSLQNRNQLILNGGDVLLRHGIFWCMFLPVGARLSVDRMIKPSKFYSIFTYKSAAALALLLQIFSVYFFSGLYKSHPVWASEGTALSHALNIGYLANPSSAFLLSSPALMSLLTYLTYYAQIILPFFLFIPFRRNLFRYIFIGFFTLFHLANLQFFDLGLFPWVNLALLAGIIPAAFWEKVKNFIRFELLRGDVRYRSMLYRTRFRRIYHMIYKKRIFRKARNRVSELSIYVIIFYVFTWNAAPFFSKEFFTEKMKVPGYILRLDQRWELFSYRTITHDTWIVIESRLQSGLQVDVLRDGEYVSYSPPKDLSDKYSWRFRLFMARLLVASPETRDEFTRYFIKKWNENADAFSQVESAKLYMFIEKTAEDNTKNTSRRLLADYNIKKENSVLPKE